MKEISIVIPAYNEEERIGNSIERIIRYLEAKKWNYEIIVVDDCSKDKTSEIVKKIADSYEKNKIRVLRNDLNRGKGYSVKRGMLEAKMKYILFSDADLSTPIEELDKFEQYSDSFDLIIGSRNMESSNITKKQPIWRSLPGKVFPLVVRMIALRGIRDTQCGFKMFSREAAQKVFPKQTAERWGFDVEVLYIAKKYGMAIKEVGITWENDDRSKVNVVTDSISMFKDVLNVRMNDLKGKY